MDLEAISQETMLLWMSSSPTPRIIDLGLCDLEHELIAGVPLLSYLRYSVDLSKANL